MKLEKKISLHAFEVEYIDQREAKPRTLHRESIVLDGGRMNTLDHLNQTPQSWIRRGQWHRVHSWYQSHS